MTLVSGWCITDDHEICPHVYAMVACTCDCHDEREIPVIASNGDRVEFTYKGEPRRGVAVHTQRNLAGGYLDLDAPDDMNGFVSYRVDEMTDLRVLRENDEAVHGQVEVVEEASGLDPEVEATQGIEDDTQ